MTLAVLWLWIFNAFICHKMSYACAMGWILFLVIFCLTLLAFKVSSRHVHYGGS